MKNNFILTTQATLRISSGGILNLKKEKRNVVIYCL